MRFSLKFLEEKGHCQYIVFFISVQKLAWVGLNEGDWEKRFIEQQLKSANSPIKQSLTLRGCHPAGPANKPDILPDNKPYHKPVNKPDILPDWRWWRRLTQQGIQKCFLSFNNFATLYPAKTLCIELFCCLVVVLTWEGSCNTGGPFFWTGQAAAAAGWPEKAAVLQKKGSAPVLRKALYYVTTCKL